MNNNLFRFLILIIAILSSQSLITSCKDDEEGIRTIPQPDIDNREDPNGSNGTMITDVTTFLVDKFAWATLDIYYLWIDDPGRRELVEATLNPDTCLSPKTTIKTVLNKEDRWTALYDNFSELLESSDGIEVTTGLDVTPWLLSKDKDEVFFVVNYVYKNSPAEAAGFKRGDIFFKLNGEPITTKNYLDFYYAKTKITLGMGTTNEKGIIDLDETREITPVKMTEDPIIATNIFDINDKKVGYLAYSSFTNDTLCLLNICNDFSAQGVTELILDLRYNGGGYLSTCTAFASMLAPKEAVLAEDIFQSNVFNNEITEFYKKSNISIDTHFEKQYADINLKINKIYALVSEITASASEGLLVGLSPYLDITIIGETTHGKFCSGYMLGPEDIFKEDFYNKYKELFKDWGIYVMIGTFSDKNGNNASRPNGLVPQYLVEDNPFDGYQLGDQNETLLRKALELAGMEFPEVAKTRSFVDSPFTSIYVERPSFSILNNKKFSEKLKKCIQ